MVFIDGVVDGVYFLLDFKFVYWQPRFIYAPSKARFDGNAADEGSREGRKAKAASTTKSVSEGEAIAGRGRKGEGCYGTTIITVPGRNTFG